ncbi:unnamed protein product [Amoebophrya sp. A25]|nr:unnamed protein product [Amoebophrya sp. A25]|eukprot:GSA25T00008896001.1
MMYDDEYYLASSKRMRSLKQGGSRSNKRGCTALGTAFVWSSTFQRVTSLSRE